MVAPWPHTTGGPGCQLISTATHQFKVWFTRAGELRVGRVVRGVQRWGVDHQEYEMAGAPRTALALPAQDDEHAYPVVAVDGLGRLHIWANMITQPLRAVRTVDPHTSDTWLATAGWTSAVGEFPSVGADCTYPNPAHLTDGGLWFHLKTDGVSGRGDTQSWARGPAATTWTGGSVFFQGLSVPDAGGPGVPGSNDTVDDVTNWLAYPTSPFVESARDLHPGRMHLSWVWRVDGIDGFSNILPSYGYSDDAGVTWKTIDGTTLTVPIHPLNSIAARVPGSALVRVIARAGSIVVAEVDSTDHGIAINDQITVAVQDATYNGTQTVLNVLTNPPRLAWFQPSADDPSGGVGSVTKTRYVNWGSVTVDPAGLPHVVASTQPTVHLHRNAGNTAWVQDTVSTSLGGVVRSSGFGGLFWFQGQLWGTAETHAPTGSHRRVRLIRITGGGTSETVPLSGIVGSGGWDATIDPEAWRRFGIIETPAPDGDWPRVFTHGKHARAVAVAA